MTSDSNGIEQQIRTFDVYDPQLQEQDLHPFFDELRRTCPVARTDVPGGDGPLYLVSRYEDCDFVLKHPEFFSSTGTVWPVVAAPVEPGQVPDMLPNMMDPPDSTDYRRAITALFSRTRVERFEPLMRREARARAEQIAAAGSCDFIEEYSAPVPSAVFLTIFGLSEDNLALARSVIEESFTTRRFVGMDRPDDLESELEGRDETKLEVNEVFNKLVADRRTTASQRDDLLSELIGVTFRGRKFTNAELVSMMRLLSAAALETTTSALNNMVAYLAEHPEQQQRLVANPHLIPSAIEELLRYDAISHIGRIVRQAVTLNDVDLQPGDRVYVLTDSAGRDDSAFPDPDRVDLARQRNRHLTWGAGIHRCLGIHFARLMMRVEVEEFHRACPRYAVMTGTTVKRRLTHIPAVVGLSLDIVSM